MTTRTATKYLGDGVYAAFDGYHVVLTTDNGDVVTNQIFLEPNVVRSLTDYVQRVRSLCVGAVGTGVVDGEGSEL